MLYIENNVLYIKAHTNKKKFEKANEEIEGK
jgi:hypothetical protein